MDTPPEGAVLDRRTLNRTLLARQLLLEPAELEPLAAVEHLVGMQAQVPLDPYVGLRARLRALDPEAVGAALLERRLVRLTLQRSTLHLVSARDALRLRPALQAMLERAFASSPFARELAGLELGPLLERAAAMLAERPRTMAELRREVADWTPDRDANALAHAVRYLVPSVQVTPRGVWGRTLRPTLTPLAAWLGRADGAAPLDELARRYLRAFGPATAADLRTWSWLPDARGILERLRPELRVYRDEAGRELFDVPDGRFRDGGCPAPVRFLPEYDNVFLSHADRSRIVDAVAWDTSFLHQGVLLADGFVAGSWKLTRSKREASLAVDVRTRVTARTGREIEGEAEALRAFLLTR